ncbi:hypothetical protein RI367_005816 [Sorochytrium milnesiophthora]
MAAAAAAAASAVGHRLRLTNVSHHLGAGDIRKWLATSELVQTQAWFDGSFESLKVKKAPRQTWAQLSFETAEAKEQAKAFFAAQEVLCKGQRVHAVEAEEEQPRAPKFKPVQRSRNDEPDTRTLFERIADQTTPLWKKAYRHQLATKQKQTLSALTNFQQLMRSALKKAHIEKADIAKVAPWAASDAVPPCPVDKVIPSPLENGYRTKCEFAVGFHEAQGSDETAQESAGAAVQATVGFMAGAFTEGKTQVIPPTGLLHVSETAIKIADTVQSFIRASSLVPYSRTTKQGHFRMVLVRTPSTGETMTVLQIHPQSLSNAEIEQLKQSFKTYFTEAMDAAYRAQLPVTVLGFQRYQGVNDQFSHTEPVELLVGTSDKVTERLLGYKFEISPTSFFQVNIPATEKLYSLVSDWATNDAHSVEQPQRGRKVLLDLCCGTGTIGICMSKHFDKVIGVEIVPEAVEDAKRNAQHNGVSNVEYHVGKVEDVLGSLLKSSQDDEPVEYVAVLDPPRNGVNASVIRAIRGCNAVRRVVYVSCDVKQATSNFIELCRPTSKRYVNAPFRPSRAVAVDLFPHTKHVETVLQFVRAEENAATEEKESAAAGHDDDDDA